MSGLHACPKCGAPLVANQTSCAMCGASLVGAPLANEPPGRAATPDVPVPPDREEPRAAAVPVLPADPEVPPHPEATTPSPPSKRRSWLPWVIGVVAVVLVGLAGTAVFLSVRGGDDPKGDGPTDSASSAASPTASPTPGIDVPVTIQDVGLRLTSAESKGRYENYHPKSRSDTFLIVSGDLDPSTEDSGKTAAKWKVSVIDQEGRVATPSITTRIRTSTATSISWVFVVAKYEQYTLHLPGQIVVDVTPLMGRDTEASPSASGVPSP